MVDCLEDLFFVGLLYFEMGLCSGFRFCWCFVVFPVLGELA